jgi:ribulose-bisphosphate carboxylase small chain
MGTRITQGNFALLPDLTDEQIKKQIEYGIKKGYAISIEYTDDPHPRNVYWELWGLPLFNIPNSAAIFNEYKEAKKAHPNSYIKVNGFSNVRGIESTSMSFIVHRPKFEPGFYLARQESTGRSQRYSILSYAVNANPEGSRYN